MSEKDPMPEGIDPATSPEMHLLLTHIQDQFERFTTEIRSDVARIEKNQPQQPKAIDEAHMEQVNTAVTLNDLAVQLFYRNEQQEALDKLEQATMINPDLPEAWNNLAMVYSALGRSEEAGEAFARALDLDANLTEVLNNHAVLHLLRGNTEEALAILERAEQDNPRYIPILMNLAQAYLTRGHPERAVRAWKMVVAIDAYHDEARQNLRQYYQ